ncbi:hypothetical protein SAMN05216413_2117 [Ruminococcaceae bacterium KH2T8]|nr:hypothetical protein SAMN05216413_2117 [Ruminococcaceae bacterium KH2T8]
MVACLVLFSFVYTLVGCVRYVKIKKQTEYHEGVSEVEEYVLSELGDYIVFREPKINEDYHRIDWFVVFTTSYMCNESQLEEHPIIETMERTRVLLNEYLADNPECIFCDYDFRVAFQIAPDKSPRSTIYYSTVGEIMNYSFITSDECGSILSSVDYYGELDSESVSFISGDSIYEIKLNFGNVQDADEVLTIIDQMPNLQYVFVDESFVSELESERPDITFIGK